jgi:hypothetical protein
MVAGWQVFPCFKISLHKNDRALLEMIQAFFNGVGGITYHGKDTIQFRAYSMLDLSIIIDHLDKYPLITKKRADFELFKQICELIKSKEHLTTEGLKKIASIRAAMNWGLSAGLKAAFPLIKTVSRPEVPAPKTIFTNWLAGFASGDGCFLIKIVKSSSHKARVQLRFTITQHSREAELLKSLVNYLGCGVYYPRSGQNAGDFIVERYSCIIEKIIPFFEKYPIMGVKALDYANFKTAVEIMQNKGHLTQPGLEEICKIKAEMNTLRKHS